MKTNIPNVTFIVEKDKWEIFTKQADAAKSKYRDDVHNDGSRYISMSPEDFVRYMRVMDFTVKAITPQSISVKLALDLSLHLNEIILNLETCTWEQLKSKISEVRTDLNDRCMDVTLGDTSSEG